MITRWPPSSWSGTTGPVPPPGTAARPGTTILEVRLGAARRRRARRAEPHHRRTRGGPGPAAARLHIASSTADADLFLTLRVLDPDGKDVTFVSGLDPAGVVVAGWLRASHRATDPGRSLPYRPWHTHDRPQPLTPGEVVALDVEIWPTSVVVPAGHRFALTVTGRDFELPGDGPWSSTYGVAMKGHGTFLHNDPDDRPDEVFTGTTTLVSGPAHPSYLLLPFVPRSARQAP
ncbi:CocE/NonD family hydrolase C-terminal non-catalytic domain-containing protein [Streptomyces sp. NPDC059718]